MKENYRTLWVLEIFEKKWGFEASIPAFLSKKEATNELRQLRKSKWPKGSKPQMRVVAYVPSK